MARSTDPRARGFNATQFRDAIKFAMKMGAPDQTSERVTFRISAEKTFATADAYGNPYDFSASPVTTVPHDDIQVDCAVQFYNATTIARGTSIGDFDTSRVVVTVLDDDFTAIETCDVMIIDTVEYRVNFVEPPVGLFDVTVYNIHGSTVDEV
jgi:hypothetical protein